MTAEFAAAFRESHPCKQCPKMPLSSSLRPALQKRNPASVKPGRLFCVFHLQLAAKNWRIHTDRRRALGLCISCHRRAVPNTGRCRKHRLYNSQKIAKWMKVNGEAHRAQQKARVEALLAAGFCRCKGHPTLPSGYRRCDRCRLRHNSQQKFQRAA